MAVVITWTKEWSSSDDGTVFSGTDLQNIQTDIEGHTHSGVATLLSELNDIAITDIEQGDVLYRGATYWNNLHHGTAGDILKSGGNAANPSWLTTLPTANGGTGSTANANAASGVVVLDSSSKLPAVDGSQLTGLSGRSQFFTASGTFTAPAGVTRVYLTMVAAGGAGGNGYSSGAYSGGGGGGGESIIKYPFTVTPSSGYTVTINASTSEFDSIIVNAGTAGSNASGSGNGAGGAGASANSMNGVAARTGGAFGSYAGGTGGTATGTDGAGGGSSMFGVGGTGGAYSGTVAATSGGYGGGGGGGATNSMSGSPGGGGFVLVEY